MNSDIRDRLRAEILISTWADLQPHADRNALFVVSQDLDLLDVACKTVADDTAAMSQWIQDGLINRPNQAQTQAWNNEPSKSFRFLIVQPYVLIQEAAH